MSRSTLREIDAEMFAAFSDAGIADTGTHRTRDGVETTVTLLHDDIAPDNYVEGPVNVGVRRRELTLQRAEVEASIGDTVVIDDTGETLQLLSISDQDGSVVRWSVTPVRGDGQ